MKKPATTLPRGKLAEIVVRASTLDERLADEYLPVLTGDDGGGVAARIRDWCQMSAQGDSEQFKKRLAWDGLDLTKVRRALGRVSLNDEARLPAWATTLQECVAAYTAEGLAGLEADGRGSRLLDPESPIPFEEVLLPFVRAAKRNLVSRCGTLYHTLSAGAGASLERGLLKSLSFLCAPTLELEFSSLRASKRSAIGRLFGKAGGPPSDEQYRGFVRGFYKGGWLTFFTEYSVLARLMATTVELWVESNQELLSRLAADAPEIQNTFQPGVELGQVVSIQPFLSDRHHGGRSVTALVFASGLRLIYKPKTVYPDRAFVSLLRWLNTKNPSLPFHLFKVLPRKDYGWVEFVEARGWKDEEEARLYYRRIGALLCLMYALEAVDMHFENIITCGQHPVVIDAETLLHAWVRKGAGDAEPGHTSQYDASLFLERSVLRTGLLPRWQLRQNNQPQDFNTLRRDDQDEPTFLAPKWLNVNTDDMILGHEKVTVPLRHSAFSPKDSRQKISAYFDDIANGFRQTYLLLMRHRAAMLAPSGPLAELAHQAVRFVFRPTKVYAFILRNTLEPRYLREGVDRSIQLDVLSRALIRSAAKPVLWPILKEERQALEQIDIPLFGARSDSDSVVLPSGHLIKNCFTEPGFSRVVCRLQWLNEHDMERQVSVIHGSLCSRIFNVSPYRSQAPERASGFSAAAPLGKDELVRQAVGLAQQLKKDAIYTAHNEVTWVAPYYREEQQQLYLYPARYCLYDGACGIALFLSALEKVTGGCGFRDLALAALHALRRELHTDSFKRATKEIGIGGALGSGSVVYSLTRIAEFLAAPDLLREAGTVASAITPEAIVEDQAMDIMSGAAGAALGLLTLHRSTGDQEALARAVACGEHLLQNRVAGSCGYRSWRTLNGNLLTGFSHGAAGIAYALLRLYEVTGHLPFRESAEEAIRYENSVFDAAEKGWPDLRVGHHVSSTLTPINTWCHGAPGIGLARLFGASIFDSSEIQRDIENALAKTGRCTTGAVDHLCCGTLGKVELLFVAARRLSRPRLHEAAMSQVSRIVARAERVGDYCYGTNLAYNPCFFQGAAGIGYQLLRFGYPDVLPSVLAWQ